ncbi:hypothetical protein OQA88_10755 [Cercophora sp. LCS_1]
MADQPSNPSQTPQTGTVAKREQGAIAPYKKPDSGYGQLQAGQVERDPVYTSSMYNAYSTTHDLALDLQAELPLFVQKAHNRVKDLVRIIQGLRRELYEARQEVIRVNQRLHDVLHRQLVLDDPTGWEEGLENGMGGGEQPTSSGSELPAPGVVAPLSTDAPQEEGTSATETEKTAEKKADA